MFRETRFRVPVRPPLLAALCASAALLGASAWYRAVPANALRAAEEPAPADGLFDPFEPTGSFLAARQEPPPFADDTFGGGSTGRDRGERGWGESVWEQPPAGALAVPPAALAGDPGGDGTGDEFSGRDDFPRDGGATPRPAAPEVPGAASVEPVLRAVYRPHPTRVESIYEFLKTHAAGGVDVTLRPIPAAESAPDDGDAEPDDGETPEQAAAGQELVVVAPADAQRALGAFLQLCVSPDAAPQTADRRTVPQFDEEGFDSDGRSDAVDFDPAPGFTDPRPDFDDAFTSRADDFTDGFDLIAADPPAAADGSGDENVELTPEAFDFADEPAFDDAPAPPARWRRSNEAT